LQAARAEVLNLSRGTAEVEERFGKYRAEKVSLRFCLAEVELIHSNRNYQISKFNMTIYLLDSLRPNHHITPFSEATMMYRSV